MNKLKVILIAITLLVTIFLGFIAGWLNCKKEPSVSVVKTYNISPQRVDEVRLAINKILIQKEGNTSDGENFIGKAHSFQSGLLLVRAPDEVHDGIKSLIDEIKNEKTQAQKTIRLDYYFITGQIDKTTNIEAFPHLASTLSTIDKVDGPRNYKILEHLGSQSLSAGRGEINGMFSEARFEARLTEGSQNSVHLNTEMRIKNKGPGSDLRIKTETNIKHGEYLVLGQSGKESPGLGQLNNESTNLYFIIHAQIL